MKRLLAAGFLAVLCLMAIGPPCVEAETANLAMKRLCSPERRPMTAEEAGEVRLYQAASQRVFGQLEWNERSYAAAEFAKIVKKEPAP